MSIVVPLFNEAAHLETTFARLAASVEELGLQTEWILVDDGSTDSTWEVLQQIAVRAPGVQGIRLSRNFGKEAALAAGLERADGDAVAVLDGDLQHPPELLATLVAHWRAGAEVVEAVKRDRGDEGPFKRWTARLFYAAFTRLTGQPLEGASDFKLMDRRVRNAWMQLGERNLFFRGMHAWLGFRRVQVPFDVASRVAGASTWSGWALCRLGIRALTAFSSAPLQLISIFGLGFLVFALGLGLQTLARKFSGHAVDGFTTVILLQLIVGGALMAGLGIIGTYIARIYDEVKQRPRYLVAETTQRLL
ncbi:glycosyltransferase family 2 protein [Inhella sp. 4Y17]|uniref:Glycosyltransferase family 2 protein n=1 Tax=Inhella gelatinilytica TaxID=2795030 RepID=A0A931IYA3_9BURK|nr:glycosyltransferase family 2 protein [Inhella gelatinilytica]